MKALIWVVAILLMLAPCGALAEDSDAVIIAKVIYAEARGADSKMEQAAVAWCILNRLDAGIWGDTVREVATSPHQFAWRSGAPVKDEFYELACDVLTRWQLEKTGIENVGRVLPKEYLYFTGRAGRNRFRTQYKGGAYWNWDCENPYQLDHLSYEDQDMIGGCNR